MKAEEIALLITDAVYGGWAKAVEKSGLLPAFINKAEAYRMYGRSNVDRWLTEGLISLSAKPGKSSNKFLDRNKLSSIAAASNRHTYLPVADRKL